MPIYDGYFNDDGVFVAYGEIVGYQVFSMSGLVIGEGETESEAIDSALTATWFKDIEINASLPCGGRENATKRSKVVTRTRKTA